MRFRKSEPCFQSAEDARFEPARARLIYTGATSMHISVHVRSGDPATGVVELTTHCLIIFVGLGEDGRPMPVPHWDAVSAEDVDLEEHARHLVELRRPLNSSSPA